jgi:hypothetical protein
MFKYIMLDCLKADLYFQFQFQIWPLKMVTVTEPISTDRKFSFEITSLSDLTIKKPCNFLSKSCWLPKLVVQIIIVYEHQELYLKCPIYF